MCRSENRAARLTNGLDLRYALSTLITEQAQFFMDTLAAGPSRIERSKRDKLERIKRAARKLFGRKGFDATTTREIAAAADIGAGTLFLYAGTKEDLLVLLFREEIGRVVRQAFATMPARSLLDRVLHLFGAMIALHERDRGLARVFVRELPFVEDRRHGIAEMMASIYAGIAGLIEDAKARGELRANVPATRLAHSMFGLYFFQLQRWLGGDPISSRQRDKGLRAVLELLLDGLRNRPAKILPIRKFNPAVRALSVVAAKPKRRGAR
jgi:AcrR family transcriptional regulator